MIGPVLAAFLALPAHSTPAADVDVAFARIHQLLSSEKGLDARSIDALDKRARAEGAALQKHGWRVVAPLGAVASDLRRPLKERLLATAFLAQTGDPLAAQPLSAVLLDEKQAALVRGAAAESLAALPLSRDTVRRLLSAPLAQETLPPEARDPLLSRLALTGFDVAETGRLCARRLGSRPDGRELEAARRAIRALSRTHGSAAVDALRDLYGWYPAGSPLRPELVAAFDAKKADLLAFRRPQARPLLEEALAAETASPKSMVTLVRLSADYGPELALPLARLARHPDAEVLVESAEALVRLKDKDAARKSLPEFEAVEKGALSDPRFSPLDGRPDPAALLSRLEKALSGLKVVANAP